MLSITICPLCRFPFVPGHIHFGDPGAVSLGRVEIRKENKEIRK